MATGMEYALARVAARRAMMVEESAWRRLETAPSPSVFLKLARETPLSRWLGSVGQGVDGMEMERQLRWSYRRHALEVAGWVPEAWREGVAWMGWLPWTPLLRPGAAALFPLASEEGSEWEGLRRGMEAEGWGYWLAEWRARWPRGAAREWVALTRLEAMVGRHGARMSGEEDGWAARGALMGALRLSYRRWEGVGRVAVYLGMSLLELERLRGAMSRRIAFGEG
ncbi:MAG: hypothetical protein HQL51_03210 [Magnetococcales bacterium]|nr:hypothetical protein [Magnetococcales bacterium]